MGLSAARSGSMSLPTLSSSSSRERFDIHGIVQRPGASAPQTRSSAWQNTSPAISVTAMALGPGLVLAEVAGSVFCPLTRVTPTSIVCGSDTPGRWTHPRGEIGTNVTLLRCRWVPGRETCCGSEPCERRVSRGSRESES